MGSFHFLLYLNVIPLETKSKKPTALWEKESVKIEIKGETVTMKKYDGSKGE